MTTSEEGGTDEGVGTAYPPPTSCPTCGGGLLVTRLQCPNCATEVSGTFLHPGSAGTAGAAAGGASGAGEAGPGASRLVNLPEPYASLLELFLRVRGNVKDVERELGLSYPTVRARLDEAFKVALPLLTAQTTRPAHTQHPQRSPTAPESPPTAKQRGAILTALERGDLTAAEATQRLRELHNLHRSKTHE